MQNVDFQINNFNNSFIFFLIKIYMNRANLATFELIFILILRLIVYDIFRVQA